MDMRMEKKVGAYAVEIGHCAKRIGNPLKVFQVCGYIWKTNLVLGEKMIVKIIHFGYY